MTRFAFLPLLLGLGIGLVATATRASAQADSKASSADEAAIRALVAEFVRAFNAGDAPGIASLFTEDARLESEDGEVVTGRPAIEKRFAEVFELAPGRSLALQTETLRLLGAEAAIEEGTAVVSIPAEGDGGEATVESSRYSAAYVKKDGKWLQDCVHDYPTAGKGEEKSAHEHLKDLEWLVGEWVDENDEGEAHTTCQWSEDGSFLLRRYRLKVQGEFVMSGVQRIGWDPRRKQFRSWVFDSEGGFSDGLWAREGDRWIIKTDGVLKDGRSAAATNIVTRQSNDVIRWASISRVVGGAALPDAEEVILVRKPPEPGPASPAPAPTEQPQHEEAPR